MPPSLSRGTVSVRAAVGYAAQIARALVAAHRQGIARGDVRSDNILLTPKGRIVVFGFGLSSVTRAESSWDVFTFAVLCRELIAGVPTSGAMPSRRFWLASAAVVGLLAFVGFALPAKRYLQRARQDAATTRVAARAPTTSSGPSAVVPAIAPPIEAATEAGAIEELAVSDSIPLAIAEPGTSIQAEVSNSGERASPGENTDPSVVADAAGDGSLAIADAVVREPPPLRPRWRRRAPT